MLLKLTSLLLFLVQSTPVLSATIIEIVQIVPSSNTQSGLPSIASSPPSVTSVVNPSATITSNINPLECQSLERQHYLTSQHHRRQHYFLPSAIPPLSTLARKLDSRGRMEIAMTSYNTPPQVKCPGKRDFCQDVHKLIHIHSNKVLYLGTRSSQLYFGVRTNALGGQTG